MSLLFRKTGAVNDMQAEIADVVRGIEEMVGRENLSTESTERFCYSRDFCFMDVEVDQSIDRKPAGSDLRQGVITLPTLCYLEGVEDYAPVNAVLSGQRDEEHVRAAIEAVCSSGAIEAWLTEARAHARRSQEALATLSGNASRQMLCSLAEYVVERRR